MRHSTSLFRSLALIAAILLLLVTSTVAQQPDVRYVFQPPPGWKLVQQDSLVSLLAREGVTGFVMVLPNGITDLKSFETEMQKGLIDEGMCKLFLKGKLQKPAKNMLVGDFEGEFQGQQAKARIIGICSEIGGGGVYVLGVDTREQFSRELAKGADAIANAIRFRPAGK